MFCTLKIWMMMFSIDLIIGSYVNSGVTQDQTSSRPNTLLDDADDIQRQLDNEARDRLQFGKSKTIWVFHLPSQFPEISTEALSRNSDVRRRAKSKKNDCSKYLSGAKDWQYSGQNKWSTIYPECGGRSQSPIDLPIQGLIKARAGRHLIFSNYDSMPESLSLHDDGKRLTLHGKWKPGRRPLIYGGAAHSRRYLFHSMAFHWPSEHFVGGFQYPIETQVIHISAEYKNLAEAIKASSRDPLAILGIANLYVFGNRTQTSLMELLKATKTLGVGSKLLTRRPISDFSPPFQEYVTYQGSLTSPPCTESVLWMVRARSLTVTRATGKLAINLLAPDGEPRRTLIRQPQPRNDRRIYLFT